MAGNSTKNTLVSVIVPAYNYAGLLPETLDNLLEQEHPHWECIIVDDGSTDNTKEVAAKWVKKDQRFSYIFQTNAGLSAARNTGIANSKGEFIQLLDADDLIEAGKFSRQIAVFERLPLSDIVYGEVRYFSSSDLNQRWFSIDEQGTLWMKQMFSEDSFQLAEILFDGNIMAVNCPLIRRSVFDAIGPFNVSLKSVEDWEYWCRCLLAGKKFRYIDEPGSYALVRTHGESMSRNTQRMMEASLKARTGLAEIIAKSRSLPKAKPSITAINDRQINFLQRELYQIYLEKGQRTNALNMLWGNYRHTKGLKHFLKEIYLVVIGRR